MGFELVSTGGSAAAIEAAGVDVRRVEDLTGFPEMLDGAPSRQNMVMASHFLLYGFCTRS